MFRVAIFLAILSVAMGFAPMMARKSSSSLQMVKEGFSRSLPFLLKPKNLDGMIGNAEFDPLGFAETFDPQWLREAEIKHGRVSMLAVVGWMVQSAGVHLPGNGALYETSNPIDAFFTILKSDYGVNPWMQIIVGIGMLEWSNHDGKMSMNDMHTTDRAIGEFKNPIYGAGMLKNKSPEYIADKKLKELQNGRLAMVAIGGMVHHQIIAGTEVFGSFPNPSLWEGLAVNMPNLYH